jgi:hypothetical protein
MTAKIHILHAEPSVAQQLWKLAPSLMRSRSSQTETEKACKAVKGEIAASELVGAFQRYLSEDPDYARHRAGNNPAGPPALHRWIRGHRWEAWLTPSVNSGGHAEAATDSLNNADNPIRTALVQALGEPFVRSYVDPYEIRDGVLIVPENKLTARAKLLENRDKLRAAGLVSMRKPDA